MKRFVACCCESKSQELEALIPRSEPRDEISIGSDGLKEAVLKVAVSVSLSWKVQVLL